MQEANGVGHMIWGRAWLPSPHSGRGQLLEMLDDARTAASGMLRCGVTVPGSGSFGPFLTTAKSALTCRQDARIVKACLSGDGSA